MPDTVQIEVNQTHLCHTALLDVGTGNDIQKYLKTGVHGNCLVRSERGPAGMLISAWALGKSQESCERLAHLG